ncbi:NAD-dependent epimerase/dehydratase family protein [Sphaerisporangium aureirubrum]|uniref:NAD-dependent epimerase/dehydratase family protein n=1 Tax=Sphaerisporangium aureirubrum TaxID=1544736 RepID=A0ABW1NTX7_9ACTN
MRVLVTGGAGFIGANLCRALAALPGIEHVTALDDLSTGSADNLDGVPVDLVEGSILDRDLVGRLVSRAGAVVHLAARPSVPRSVRDPIASHTVNATGTLNVLEACRSARTRPHVICASSSSVYGDCAVPYKSEDLPVRPLSPYGASKLAMEAYALAYASSYGLPVLTFRFFNVYGPLQAAGHAYAAVVPVFLTRAAAGETLPIHGDGRQARDFTYVGSVARVLCDAVTRRVTCPGPVNLAFGTRVSLLELADLLGRVLGRPVRAEFLPPRVGDIRESRASPRLLLGLFPGVRPVVLEEGLRATAEWFATAPLGAPG